MRRMRAKIEIGFNLALLEIDHSDRLPGGNVCVTLIRRHSHLVRVLTRLERRESFVTLSINEYHARLSHVGDDDDVSVNRQGGGHENDEQSDDTHTLPEISLTLRRSHRAV